jgi:hypothetical protein
LMPSRFTSANCLEPNKPSLKFMSLMI